MMTRWFVVALCGLFAVPVFAQETIADGHEQTRKLLKLCGAANQVKAALDAMIPQFTPIISNQMHAELQKAGSAELDPGGYEALTAAVLDEFRKNFTIEAAVESLVPIYERHFTPEEIGQLIQIYQSPIGAKLASVGPALLTEGGEVGGKLAQKTNEQMRTPEFQRKVAQIVAQHSIRPNSEKSKGADSPEVTVVVPRTVTDHDKDKGQSAVGPFALDPAKAEKLGPGQARISGAQAMPLLARRAGCPAYPPQALQGRIQGTVRVEAVIGKNGRVTHEKLISGHPLLAPEGERCIKQWVFRPMTLDGEPVEVTTQLDLTFTLSR